MVGRECRSFVVPTGKARSRAEARSQSLIRQLRALEARAAGSYRATLRQSYNCSSLRDCATATAIACSSGGVVVFWLVPVLRSSSGAGKPFCWPCKWQRRVAADKAQCSDKMEGVRTIVGRVNDCREEMSSLRDVQLGWRRLRARGVRPLNNRHAGP